MVLYSNTLSSQGLLVSGALPPSLVQGPLCPVGRLYGIFGKVSLLRLFTGGTCARCSLCDQVCYMGVEIARHADEEGLEDGNCICSRCDRGCETQGNS
ncbi:MAG: hypothetical protein MZV70_01140 [Desulfobacterales bacterium]|nr:hypothetical protein [Desulfobacterales bacterium]